MSAHTPGPWTVLADYIVTALPDGSVPISSRIVAPLSESRPGGRWEVSPTDAALIAAAPELLEALRVLVDHAQEAHPHFESERGQRDIGAAIAAIAKAEGSS